MSDRQLDEYLFHQGTLYRAYELLGSFMERRSEKYVYTFRVYAPNALGVSLISDFTDWSVGIPLKKVTEKGIYQLEFISDSSLEGKNYKYLIHSKNGDFKKGDPYARRSRGYDDGASVIYCEKDFKFTDSSWMENRKKSVSDASGNYLPFPMNIYEIHLGSFMRHKDGSYYSYSELCEILPTYLKKMGYTHVEFLPLTEYPFDGSWGYQVGAFYAPTNRFGEPFDLKKLVNTLHLAGIGVIMDWVPAHFPKDEWGLYEFDGEPLYEYQGLDRQQSRSWGTRFFDLGREEIQSFLISNALYYLREFHFDGLRVDAVASMLYLDYDRDAGEWIPNDEGTNLNKEAEAFIKKLSSAIFSEFGDVLMIAEESTAFGRVTSPVYSGGLGFNLKWNMGFANDLYDYLSSSPKERRKKHSALTFPIMYAFSENYVLPISHDEVVHGKKSFIDKMYGSYEDKFRTARTAMLLLMSYPGKKLLFMGTEYAQFREWDFEDSLEWFMLDYPKHSDFRNYIRELNDFYLKNPPLYELDFSPEGFCWLLVDEAEKCSVAYRRLAADGNSLIFCLNFSNREETLHIKTEECDRLLRVFDTGDGQNDPPYYEVYEKEGSFFADIHLFPLSGIVLKETRDIKKIKI